MGKSHPTGQTNTIAMIGEAKKSNSLEKKCFEPISEIHKLDLAGHLRTIKWITDDDLAQFCERIDIAIHAIE